jgi:hypothetical protein
MSHTEACITVAGSTQCLQGVCPHMGVTGKTLAPSSWSCEDDHAQTTGSSPRPGRKSNGARLLVVGNPSRSPPALNWRSTNIFYSTMCS